MDINGMTREQILRRRSERQTPRARPEFAELKGRSASSHLGCPHESSDQERSAKDRAAAIDREYRIEALVCMIIVNDGSSSYGQEMQQIWSVWLTQNILSVC
jgi:hypothetical protein